MRERRYLTFDMSDPRHTKALLLYSSQPDKLKSEFVIECILRSEQERRMENLIRQTISEMLVGSVSLQPKNIIETAPTSDISELPGELLFMMEDF